MADIIFRSLTTTTGPSHTYKVKSKGKKCSKVRIKTPLNVLNRAEQDYAFTKPAEKVPNTGFERQKRVMVREGKHLVNRMVVPNIRHIQRVKSEGIFADTAAETVNRLLRNVLLFKGIGFAQLERDTKLNGATTYAVNTEVHINGKAHSVHTIRVKRTFRNEVNVMGKTEVECRVFIDRDSCSKVAFWLNSLNFKF